jgi:transcription initiation factor TFIID subunit 1
MAPTDANAYAPVLYALPSLDDPERATAKVAKSVVLDLNDPKLLVDIHQSTKMSKRARRYGGILKRRLSGSRTRDLSKRYNISNDIAYEQLKENQSKVRSTIGNLTVEHSMPAARLQYPYVRIQPLYCARSTYTY